MGFIDLFQQAISNVNDQPTAVKVILGVALAGFIIYSIITKVLPKLLLVPPYNWVDKVVAALQSKNLRLRPSTKIGSYRRRLVLGSLQPSLYSTTDQITGLKIPKVDKDNELEFLKRCKIKKPDDPNRKKIYGVFHPYCNSGGGGEKVLWELVNQILTKDENNLVVIYHGEKETPKDILLNVARLFGLKLSANRIVFIYLSQLWMIDPKSWPVLTLLGQAFGSIVLAFEAIYKLSPDVWVDSVGLPFSYPLIGLSLKIPIFTYTHFPVIQSDMLSKLNKRTPYGLAKYVYWFAFLVAYRICGKFVSLALVNSTWTYDHIVNIWRLEEGRIIKCYPICSPEKLLKLSSESKGPRQKTIVSLSQFREEKRHDLIIKEYAKYLSETTNTTTYDLKLIGSIRSHKDLEKIETLKKLVAQLEIPDGKVQFITDCKYEDLLQHLVSCEIGLNAMWNEHFGIVVVEYMAAGLIPVVHASAGPYMDIVVPWDSAAKELGASYTEETRTGFYFKSETDPDYRDVYKEYFQDLGKTLLKVEALSEVEKTEIRQRARQVVLSKFSDDVFKHIVNESLSYIDQLELFFRVDKRDKVEQLY